MTTFYCVCLAAPHLLTFPPKSLSQLDFKLPEGSLLYCFQNIFVRISLSQTDNIRHPMISNAPENNSSAVFFMRLKLKRECREADVEVGESEVGIGF